MVGAVGSSFLPTASKQVNLELSVKSLFLLKPYFATAILNLYKLAIILKLNLLVLYGVNSYSCRGASLCSGNLHPDAVLQQEQCFKTSKKSYYSELRKYHNKFPKQAERSISTDANESRDHDAEEDLGATSESGSWAANESSDNQYLMTKHGELQKCQVFMEDKYDSLSTAGHKVAVRPRKGEKLHKKNIHCSDGSRYMSYIKVTREQHHRVKCSMKNSSNNCIQSRSLNRVLGNLDTFHVQPIEVFEEEERKKLHQHWLQLATKDLPVAFANWRTQWIKKWQLAQSLAQEMEEKLKSLKEDEEKEIANMLPDHKSAIASEDEERENLDTIVQEIIDNEVAKREPTLEADNESLPVSAHNQHLLPIPSLSGSHEFHPMDLDSNNQVIMETDDIPANGLNYPENFNCVGIAVSQGDPLSSTSDVWPAESMPSSYYLSPLIHCYASAPKRPLGHLRLLEKQPARLIDRELDNQREDTLKDLLHIQRNERSFFNPYPDQEVQGRNELLQHFFKGQEGLRYHHEEKQTRLDLQPASSASMETGRQFSAHFREQQLHPLLPLELRQKKLNDDIMHQNIQEKIFSGGGRYSIPRQEQLLPVNVQDWAVNSTHTSKPLQSQLDGRELGRNWFPGEHRVHGGWRSLDGVGPTQIQSVVNRSNGDDQSLFGVVTQCNELHPYDSVGSNEHYIQPGTTYGAAVGALFPTASNMLPQPPQSTAHPLNYFREHEEAASVAKNNNNIGCMSMRHQNSALQESMVKPFLRPWNK
ncbi:hypothetical protein U1Q18_012635 [Sarracenia purpurea var. burkii]